MGKLEESEVSQSGQHMQMITVESAITNKGKRILLATQLLTQFYTITCYIMSYD